MSTRAAAIARLIEEEWREGEYFRDFVRRRLSTEAETDIALGLDIAVEVSEADVAFDKQNPNQPEKSQ